MRQPGVGRAGPAAMRELSLLSMRLAPLLLLALLLLLGGAAAETQVQIDILPGAGPTSAEVVAQLRQLMATDEGRARLEQFDLLGLLPEEMAVVEVVGPETPAIDVSSASDMRAAAASDVAMLAGGDLDASAAGNVALLGGSLSAQTPGTLSAVAGEVDLYAAAGLAAATAGAAQLTADAAHASVAGGLSADAGEDITLTGGGKLTLNAAESGSVAFGGALEASASRVDMQAAEGLTATAPVVDVMAQDAMRVQTSGAVLELSGGDEVEYVSFRLRTPSAFDAFETAVPPSAGVTSVVIASDPAGGAMALDGACLFSRVRSFASQFPFACRRAS